MPALTKSTTRPFWDRTADLVALSKPRITSFVLFTTAIGLWLAPAQPSLFLIIGSLFGLTATVAGVNALNMYLEQDVDGLMVRTQDRPLPAGRLQPKIALWFGTLLSLIGVLLVGFSANLFAGLLTLLAVISYVLLYTPLKRFTPSALYVGAVPGALPPLIGWVAARGTIELPALSKRN